MKLAYLLLIFLSGCMGFGDVKTRPAESGQAGKSIYDYSFRSIEGEKVNFSDFKGKKIFIVNTASKCGFTPQFEDLQRFHEKYKDSVVVIGFPSNDFANQDPGSEEEIAEFCQKNYGVTFLMGEKVQVKGSDKSGLYKWLSDSELNGWNDQEPKWNFCKYLINGNGQLIGYYASAIKPFDDKILEDLQK